MKKLLFILIYLSPLLSFGQLKLKEVTEYYPKTKTIKSRYFVIKPKKKVYHGKYEYYQKNGQLSEKGYFNQGIKTAFIKFNSKGQITKGLEDSVLTKNTYFPNGELKSTEISKNGKPFGTWETYHLNECDKPLLISSIKYQNGKIISKTESINNMFLGIFSLNTLVTKDSLGKIDTTQVYTTSCEIIYPSKARRNQIEGTLFIKINLTGDCDFTYELVNELGYGIEDQFIEKLELAKNNLLANPYCKDFEVTIPMKFKLQ